MRITLRTLCASITTVLFTPLAPVVHAQTRTQVSINDTAVNAENLTSSRDGTVYFGSMAKGTIYRAAPGASQAEPWILASTAGLTNVLGVLADCGFARITRMAEVVRRWSDRLRSAPST